MLNPLFVGFVAYVINLCDTATLEDFEDELVICLEDLQDTEELTDLEWFDELEEEWTEQLGPELIEASLDKFQNLTKLLSLEDLATLAVMVRNSLMLESLPDHTYSVKSLQAVFMIQWHDGTQAEYSCRPVLKPHTDLDGTLMGELNDRYTQQFIELLIKPGLDPLHDQVAQEVLLACRSISAKQSSLFAWAQVRSSWLRFHSDR